MTIKEVITAANWRIHPNNQWSFQNIEKLFATEVIKKNHKKQSVFSSNLSKIDAIEFVNLEEKKQTVREMLINGYADSFLVLKKGEIIFEEYFNGMSQESLHLLNSISKNFTGMLTGVIVKLGLINVDEKVINYLPKLKDSAFNETTVRQVLDMTAAVRYDEDYNNPTTDFWQETSAVGWSPNLLNKNSSDLFNYALSLKDKEQKDGSSYHYRTVLTNVLGMIIEAATGKKISILFEEFIWKKLYPEQNALIVVDNKGVSYTGAGMNACTRDLARFGLMLSKEGYFEGEEVIPPEWIKDTVNADKTYKDNFSKDL
ncbi:MAG: serine hydrolase, partial [Pseudomonadota bacterium]|nr:serine hydrolase [Pseudomonadota bacterium]